MSSSEDESSNAASEAGRNAAEEGKDLSSSSGSDAGGKESSGDEEGHGRGDGPESERGSGDEAANSSQQSNHEDQELGRDQRSDISPQDEEEEEAASSARPADVGNQQQEVDEMTAELATQQARVERILSRMEASVAEQAGSSAPAAAAAFGSVKEKADKGQRAQGVPKQTAPKPQDQSVPEVDPNSVYPRARGKKKEKDRGGEQQQQPRTNPYPRCRQPPAPAVSFGARTPPPPARTPSRRREQRARSHTPPRPTGGDISPRHRGQALVTDSAQAAAGWSPLAAPSVSQTLHSMPSTAVGLPFAEAIAPEGPQEEVKPRSQAKSRQKVAFGSTVRPGAAKAGSAADSQKSTAKGGDKAQKEKARALKLFQAMDTDASGQVDEREWLRAVESGLLRIKDPNSSGQVPLSALVSGMEALGFGGFGGKDQPTYMGFRNAVGDRDGYGVMRGEDGTVYAGQWVKGSRNGRGTLFFSGGVFEGQWRKGNVHGQGMVHFKNGDVFQGIYTNNRKSGRGVYSWSSGAEEIGEYVRGSKHGWHRWQHQQETWQLLYDHGAVKVAQALGPGEAPGPSAGGAPRDLLRSLEGVDYAAGGGAKPAAGNRSLSQPDRSPRGGGGGGKVVKQAQNTAAKGRSASARRPQAAWL